MPKQEFEDLLKEFRDLAVEVGDVSFDLRWHHFPGRDVESPSNGGRPVLAWPEVEESDLPFDTADRFGIGRLFRVLEMPDGSAAVGSGWVTIPRGPTPELMVPDPNNTRLMQRTPLWHKFRKLSERAGGVLPPEHRRRNPRAFSTYWTGHGAAMVRPAFSLPWPANRAKEW